MDMTAGRVALREDSDALKLSLWVVLAACVAATFGYRVIVGQGLPLWIDETWTAMIAGQPNWEGFWREASLDCNPPLYYLLMKLWLSVAGDSNWALRLPGVCFLSLAALLPLIWRPAALSRMAAATWGLLICFWWSGALVALSARGYSLLLLISVAQAIAFLNLLERPTLARAATWCGFACLAILTHYHAAYVGLAQGLIYLTVHRWRAVRTWPAILMLAPAVIWGVHHLPRLLEYARPDVAWYPPTNGWMIFAWCIYLLGPALTWLAFLFLATALISRALAPRRPERLPWSAADWTALSGLLAFALAAGVSLVKPSLTARYLTPMVPLVMLWLVMLSGKCRWPRIAWAVLALEFASVPLFLPGGVRKALELRTFYGWERASEFVAPVAPARLVFFWDHPATQVLDRRSLEQVGGFFLKRNGTPTVTVAPRLATGEDPNVRLPAEAGEGSAAIIWLYNTERRTLAATFPPRFMKEQPGWRCQVETQETIGVVACVRSSGRRDPSV